MATRGETFLGEVARSLYSHYGADFFSLSLLFPSRRARLFFADELARIADRPLWEPEWLSLDRLFEELSGLHTGDRLRLIVELHQIYRNYHDEDFASFYFWGDRLLADFDMVDKYRVDAELLFRNIADLKELEADLSYLSAEQRKIINLFWQGVLNEAPDSPERQKFLKIWNSLGPIYQQFRARQLELGFAYAGLVQRVAADRLERGEASLDGSRRYVVAGFNALSECEKRLFDHLKALEADFYWDYDESYLRAQEQEAGMFLRENHKRYPEALGEISHDNSKEKKELSVYSFVSDAVQCKFVGRILDSFRTAEEPTLDKRTAVVLTNEGLLMPLLSSLDGGDTVNVTMGFPLKQSAAYTFVERLVELQTHSRSKGEEYNFYHADVMGILSHPYLGENEADSVRNLKQEIIENRLIRVPASLFSENALLATIFHPVQDWQILSDWLLRVLEQVEIRQSEEFEAEERIAALQLIADEICRLRNSIELCDIELTTSIYTSLLRKHLQTLRIPFDGEPLNGLQVMGILETRNLDFENVVILSMTDDNFPGRLDSGASYIPYNLRAAYGLPTPEHHEGVHSYYFYRLIQRAKRVVMCYCSHADEKSTGEASRYIRQLEYESGRPIRFYEVGVDLNLPPEEAIVVPKEGRVREALEGYLRAENPKSISPTAFARYLACPLKFYFASIAHLKERDEVSEDVDNPLFGTLLHESMELLYKRILGEAHPAESLKAMVRAGEVEVAVRQSIESELFRGKPTPEAEYPGNLLLVRDIVVSYIRENIIPYDCRQNDFKVEGLELPVKCDFLFDGKRRVCLAGKADRVDRLDDGTLRVVDYKTGGIHLMFNGLDDLFESRNRTLNANIFQTLLYALMLRRDSGADAQPALYYVRRLNRADFSPYLVDKSSGEEALRYSQVATDFEQRLSQKLQELFDYSLPFRPCEDVEPCRFCEFKSICRK